MIKDDVIIPPLEIKNKIDSTAKYIAKQGKKFEEMILDNKEFGEEFSFIFKDNVYHNYYINKIKELKINNNEKDNNLDNNKNNNKDNLNDEIDLLEEDINENKFILNNFILTEEKDEIIKTTAQYVALNGENFLNNITNREKNNIDFDFLNELNPNFIYFTKLVEQYNYLLNVDKSTFKELEELIINKDKIISQCKKYYNYYKNKEKNKILKNNEDGEEFVDELNDEYEWDNFTIVKVINFD